MTVTPITVPVDPATIEELLVTLVPDGTGFAACRADTSLVEQLTDGERMLVRSARPMRHAEFAAGRLCARRALSAINAGACSIGRGRRGQPIWPRGVTGSISHAGGVAVAIAARATPAVAGLGIDVERSVPRDLWSQLLTPSERAACEAADDPGTVAVAIFSAKEAAFKAVYPLVGAEIGFLDAHSELEAGTGHIEIPSLGVATALRYGRAGPLTVSVAIITATA